MKRILCFVLAICVFFSVFVIPVFASETGINRSDYSTDVARGKELGFDKFIDVETYACMAGTVGYDTLKALRIDTPEIVKFQLPTGEYRYSWVISIYFYNPNKVIFSTGYDEGDVSCPLDFCYAWVKADSDSDVYAYDMGLSYPDGEGLDWMGEHELDDVFFKASISGLAGSHDLIAEELTFYVKSLKLGGWVNSEYTDFEIEIDKTMQLEGIDHKMDYTTPYYDLSAFYDVDIDDIKSMYPANEDGEPSIAYLYEREYGTDNYGLYLYLYNPTGAELASYSRTYKGKYVYATAYMNFGGYTISSYDFTLVSSSATMVKLKCLSELPVADGLEIRDYYISNISFQTYSDSNIEKNLIADKAHYEYCESPLTDVEKLQFEYSAVIDALYLGKDFDKGISYDIHLFFDTDKEICIYTENNNELAPLTGFKWDNEIGGYVCSSSVEGTSLDGLIKDNGCLKPIIVSYLSDFPTGAPDIMSCKVFLNSFYLVDGVNQELNLSLSMKGFTPIGRSVQTSAVTYIDSEAESGSAKSKYMRSDLKQELEIKCDSTFYRLNSSDSGTLYQKTLTTVGFALDASYFHLDDLEVENDCYLDFINCTYREGYLKPAFVTTDGSFISANRFLPGASRVYLYSGYIYTSGDISYDVIADDEGYTIILPYIWFGSVPDSTSAYEYAPSKQYDYVPFVFMVEHEGDFEDFEYVLTQEEIEAVLKKFSEEYIFDGDVVPVDKTITFKDKTELLSYRDATFDQVKSDFGFFSALWHKWFGMDDTVMESIGNINCIEMILPDEYLSILDMSDEEFSSTYLVALNEAADMKAKVLDALSKNQVYTFLRFDTYDYYAADATVEGLEHNGDAFIFQEKYYKDFDIIELGISNEQETVVYNVKMDPINIMAGATTPDPVVKDDIVNPGEYIEENFDGWWRNFVEVLKRIGKVAVIITGVVLLAALIFGIVRLVIYIRNTRTLNKMRRQIKDKNKQHRKRK